MMGMQCVHFVESHRAISVAACPGPPAKKKDRWSVGIFDSRNI